MIKQLVKQLCRNYPLESDIIIDLTQVEDVTSAQKQIERAVDLHIKSNSNEESYSVFIMAKSRMLVI